MKPIIQDKVKEHQKLSEGRGKKGTQNSADLKKTETRKELAKLAGVSHDTIDKAEKIISKGTPEQIAKDDIYSNSEIVEH